MTREEYLKAEKSIKMKIDALRENLEEVREEYRKSCEKELEERGVKKKSRVVLMGMEYVYAGLEMRQGYIFMKAHFLTPKMDISKRTHLVNIVTDLNEIILK